MLRQNLVKRTGGNPYSVRPGFSGRVADAAEALRRLASNPLNRASVQARNFDNCFEMWDGNAVIWELVNRAHEGDELLARGIAALGPTVWHDWCEIYECRTRGETHARTAPKPRLPAQQ